MMTFDNQIARLRKEVLIEVARATRATDPVDAISRVPATLRPRDSQASRCCLYKDRQLLKYRTMAALGFGVEDDVDELLHAGDFYAPARQRQSPVAPALTVMDLACSACRGHRPAVTNACRGCLGQACATNCRKDAIRFVNSQAVIDPDKCVNCGLCLQACPYHAIVRQPVPCEEACPVKAIAKDEHGHERIDPEKCIHCGQCLRACPFGAILERSQMIDVMQALEGPRPLTALLAPAITGQFPGTRAQLHQALAQLGFATVTDVADAAAITALNEAAEWVERINEGAPFMTTSCCPAFTAAVDKHIPELKPYVSHTPSPMATAAAIARERQPQTVNVFIGPCLAKRAEADRNPDVQYVLTFEELGAMLVATGIDVQQCVTATSPEPSAAGLGFAASGGVTTAVAEHLSPEGPPILPVCINGLNHKMLARLRQAPKRGIDGNFAEVMCCEGGCLAGPAVLSPPSVTARQLKKQMQR